METVELVIKLPKTFYEELKAAAEANDEVKHMILANAIVNGYVIPRGHGRLFDERDIVFGDYQIIGNKIYEIEPVLGADKIGADKK